MGDQRLSSGLAVVTLERKPQELASPRCFDDAPAGERSLEVEAIAGVTGERALVEHGDAEDESAGDRGCEAGTDDFDLGEFRHVR
jgi:hypothetical protein